MMKQNNTKKAVRTNSGPKEVIRKILVSLKKNPQAIPLLALTVSVVVFSFNLTDISNTTAKIYGANMGFCAFIALLFSILSYVCMFNAYPKRSKPNIPMIVILIILYSAIICADLYYYNRIIIALTREVSPIEITPATAYIADTKKVIIAHIITVIITMICVVLEPVFAKLLKKIDTSIEVEGNGNIGVIDISDEE